MLDKGVRVAIYCYVYEHYKLVSLPWDSMLTWAVAALAVDFFYYWAHRAVHGKLHQWSVVTTHLSKDPPSLFRFSVILRKYLSLQSYWFQFALLFEEKPLKFV